MDRFSIEIETLYFNDAGTQDNVFKLTDTELKHRVIGKNYGLLLILSINFYFRCYGFR